MSVDFDPVRIRPRRRRVDPLVVGVVVVGLALAAAVIKPWETRDRAIVPAPSGAAAVAGPTPTPIPRRSPRPTPTPGSEPPAWGAISPVVTPHETLGIRTIVAEPGLTDGQPATDFGEGWQPAIQTGGVDAVAVANEDRAIVAMGPTFPSDAGAEDVRIWRVHAGGVLEWVDARPIEPEDPVGFFLFVRTGVSGAPYPWWPAGTYRIDVLSFGGIHRIDVAIPGRFGLVPGLDDVAIPVGGLIPAAGSDQSSIRVGLFATADGHGVALPAKASPPLDEETSWRDLIGLGGGVVATAFLPRATGLGVMLTPNAVVEGAEMQRLSPGGAFAAPPVRNGISESNNRTPDVYFEAPDGAAWPPGVYALTVRWHDADGEQTGTWHVELRPGSG